MAPRTVHAVIQDLKQACRRPLYEEVCLVHEKAARQRLQKAVDATTLIDEKIRERFNSINTETVTKAATWQELLAEASNLAPGMTEAQHGEVVQLASILFLGYLMPYSTGNEFQLLQYAPRTSSSFDPVDYILTMPLMERLERSQRTYTVMADDQVTDDHWELAFHMFLRQGLVPLLHARPCHARQVDLLHLLAMAVHPQPTSSKSHRQQSLQLLDDKSPAFEHMVTLMHHPAAFQFQIPYRMRLQLVQALADHLLWNDLSEGSDSETRVLLAAFIHMRASLRQFASSAHSVVDAHMGHATLVALACQTRHSVIVGHEWDYILHRMVEDPTQYGCTDCHCKKRRHGDSILPPANVPLCPHAARGRLLAELMMRSCRNKHDAPPVLLQKIATSLTDGIEWQLDCWRKDDEKDDTSKLHAPCLLASLVAAACSLFDLLPITEEQDDYVQNVATTLVESSIQLLRHPSPGISRASAQLTVMALQRPRMVETVGPTLFKILVNLLEQPPPRHLVPVFGVSAQRSHVLASSLLKACIAKAKVNASDENASYHRLVAMVCSNSPAVALKLSDQVTALMDTCTSDETRSHIAVACLSMRQARYFSSRDTTPDKTVQIFLTDHRPSSSWSLYQLAQHALVTGNAQVAATLYQQILRQPLSDKHYLWMSVLEQVALAEAILSKHAALGIPDGVTMLRTALWHMGTLQRSLSSAGEGYQFQLRFIQLRVEFLDLMTVLSQFVREMRLTGAEPAKHTRPYLHLQSLIRCFDTLAAQYYRLLQQFGLLFQSEKSRTMLRCLQSEAQFMALATRKLFADVLPPFPWKEVVLVRLVEGQTGPMASLMRKLCDLVVDPMDASVSETIRAAAGVELIDAMLMVGCPIPVDFLRPMTQPVASLTVAGDPEFSPTSGSDGCTIEGCPSICSTIHISGTIPSKSREQMALPCWTVLLWCHITYAGPLLDEEEAITEEELPRETIEQRVPDCSANSPLSAPLSLDGSFFLSMECPPLLDEGMFTLKFSVGCRDSRGNEWELAVPDQAKKITMRISRSNR